ncbi:MULTISPECIES: ATP-binding cassette domain-containing protein [Haloarcula]|uniref:ATP-binding cassette domain-containing protein n=1 Tax=Haloarcula TaxID=2237 RepID=UPI0023EE1E24|nr:ATP-binding cassette domain-containing protein [Halomicroarcula sp. XH51]
MSHAEDASESSSPAQAADVKVRFENIMKQFGRLVALESIDLTVRDGEILALVGDNGAGKSTLMNILCGVHEQTSGTVYYDGEPVTFSNPSEAREMGIETVYQDLALMNELDIATNVYMDQFPSRLSVGPVELIDWNETYRETAEILDYLNLDLDPHSEVSFLSGGERQLVAIARAISFDPDVLILDEPTSALSVAGTELVHETMHTLRDEGHTQVVVSHSFESVLDLADRIAVLYQGEIAEVVEPEDVDKATLTNLITTGHR